MKKLFQIGLLLLLATPVIAQESSATKEKVLRVYDWKNLPLPSTNCQIVSMDGISVLKIENTNDTPLKFSFLTVTNSSLLRKAKIIEWDMKYENVHTLPDLSPWKFGGRWQIREKFLPQVIGGDNLTNDDAFYFEGTKNWNENVVPILRAPYDLQSPPNELNFTLTLPSTGTVYLRPIKLLGTAESFNWWSSQQAGRIGGIGGAIIGCLGGLIGCLAGMGKARRFVLAMTKFFIALGILSLVAGGIAAATKQPYAVYYPLLLMGFILTLVCSINLPSIQRRYDELEIRRMTSIDTMR